MLNITSEAATSPSVQVKHPASPFTTIMTHREFMAERTLPPSEPPRPSKSTLATFINRNAGGGAGRDVSLPAPIKPLGSQSVFSDSMRLSRMELKEKITKEFDIDNW